jgi:hypothetical protein
VYEQDDIWLNFKPLRRLMRSQGWKIHLSTGVTEAHWLIQLVGPYLLNKKLAFKLPKTVDAVASINSGQRGRLQIGKIVSVYPGYEGDLSSVIAELDELWRSSRAPEIVSDIRTSPNSSVYIRYGAIMDSNVIVDKFGNRGFAIRTPDGEFVLDNRRKDGQQPWWAKAPDALSPLIVRPSRPRRKLVIAGESYIVFAPIHDSPRGATYIAMDARYCTWVIKTANRGVSEDLTGVDSRGRLQRENVILGFLLRRKFRCPFVRGSVFGPASALVLQDIKRSILSKLSRDELQVALPKFAGTVAQMHAMGLVHRD